MTAFFDVGYGGFAPHVFRIGPVSYRHAFTPSIRRRQALLDAGIYVVRYDEGGNGTARIGLVRPAAPGVAWLPEPGADPDVLTRPGDFAVLRCDGRAEVEFALRDGGADASISILKIHRAQVASLAEAPGAGRPAGDSAEPADAGAGESIVGADAGAGESIVGLALLAHVSGIGDIIVGADEWAGGGAIEGFQLRWPKCPAGLTLTYAALAGSTGERRIEPRGESGFAGTRGRASPLAGAEFGLEGPDAGRYGLVAEARFDRGAPVAFRGTRLRVAASRPGQRLTGLKLGLRHLPEAPAPRPVPVPTPRAEAPETVRARVFRSARP